MHPLLERAKCGDPEATDVVVRTLESRLSRMAVYYGRRSGEDPDDLLQEAWIGLLAALPDLDINIGSPEQYLIRHARWQMLDALRRARIRRSLSLDDEIAAAIPSPTVTTGPESAFVAEFLKELTMTQRKVLEYLMDGFTWREAGKFLGCTSANVAYYVRQIKQKYERWSAL